MKKITFLSLLSAYALLNTTFAGSTDLTQVTVMRINNIFPDNLYFTAMVKPTSTITLSFDKSGQITYLKEPGDYVHSIGKGTLNNFSKSGTFVAVCDDKKERLAKNESAIAKDIAKTEMIYKKGEEARTLKLNRKHAISDAIYRESQTEYLKAKLKYEMAKIEYKRYLFALNACFLTSPISGIVKQVFTAVGNSINSGGKVMEIMEMDSVFLKIEIPSQAINLLKKKLKVLVFPVNNAEPIESYTSFLPTDRNHIYIYLSNTPTQGLNNSLNRFPKIFNVYKINYANNKTLGIPKTALRYDNTGFYVFKTTRKHISKDSTLDPQLYTLSRVNVMPVGSTSTIIDSKGEKTIIYPINESKNLKNGDFIAGKSCNILNDSEEVLLTKENWLFFPGQIIKVKIPELIRPGIYIPATAIIQRGDNNYFVYVAKTGKAKLKMIKIRGFYGKYFLIAGLSPGEKIIVNTENTKLYDGCNIIIINIINPPVRKRVDLMEKFDEKKK
jgi:hypothetical protein